MNLRTARRNLQRAFPIKRRVVVSRDDEDDGNLGTAWMEGETIRINIAPSLPDEEVHTLAHEWAHGRIYDRHGSQRGRHGVEWAREYAAIYRHFFDA